VFLKQPMMRKVLYALTPIYLFALYMYGINLVILSIFVFLSGILTEFIMEKAKKKKQTKVSEAVLVTCMLMVLSLPPLVSPAVAIIGTVFAVLFGKMVYGGFGRNIFNPAIVGRLFLYITFANQMTMSFVKPGNWGIDALSAATPLALMRSGETVSFFDMFFGNRAGSFGEAPTFLIIIGAVYLIITKTASWRIITSTFLSGFLLASILYASGVGAALDPITSIMGGSFLFVTVFMATDPVSAPKKNTSHFIYGFIIGITAILVRTFSLFPEGTSFAILTANTFAALIDLMISSKKKVKS